MNRAAAISLLKQIGVGVVLVLAVSLLTAVFTILGTIMCSALVGVMCGSIRQLKWQTILVSLVFPGVILAFLQLPKNDLTLEQSIQISLLCMGLFWGMYVLTFFLVGYEKRNRSPAQSSISPPTDPTVASDEHHPASSDQQETALPSLASNDPPLAEPVLAELQGRWSFQPSDPEGRQTSKIIEIEQNKFALSVTDFNGQFRCVCRGDMEVGRLGPFRVLRVLLSVAESPATEVAASNGSCQWIYRIRGRTLTLAAHFEESAGESPVTECYARVSEAQASS